VPVDVHSMSRYDGHALAPLGRRVAAWTFDAVVGLALAVGLLSITGVAGDLGSLWHLFAFKSVNGKAGHQLSAAMHPGPNELAALRPIAVLLIALAVIAVVGVAYRVVTTAAWGQGLGKLLFGLKVVVDEPSEVGPVVPGWRRSLKRWAVPQAPGLIPLPATGLLAYLPAMRDPRRRGLHDRAAGTVVIDTRAPFVDARVADWSDTAIATYFPSAEAAHS
jgi:uncharacterized RDD family membrane protein YckC